MELDRYGLLFKMSDGKHYICEYDLNDTVTLNPPVETSFLEDEKSIPLDQMLFIEFNGLGNDAIKINNGIELSFSAPEGVDSPAATFLAQNIAANTINEMALDLFNDCINYIRADNVH